MKRVGQSLDLRLTDDGNTFYIYAVLDDFIPLSPDELPFNTLSLDGTAATAVSINSFITTVILRE